MLSLLTFHNRQYNLSSKPLPPAKIGKRRKHVFCGGEFRESSFGGESIYNKETFPILSYYQSKKLLQEIDGMNEIDQIYKEIQAIITPLEA